MIGKKQIEHLAELAKIELEEKELRKFLKDIQKILAYVNEIQDLDLREFEPLIGGAVQYLFLREDVKRIIPEEVKRKIIEQFPEKVNNYLKVPKIIKK